MQNTHIFQYLFTQRKKIPKQSLKYFLICMNICFLSTRGWERWVRKEAKGIPL